MNGAKSKMPSEPVDEMLLVRYLLGTFPNRRGPWRIVPSQTRTIWALEAAEADLIDTYVHGGLSQIRAARIRAAVSDCPQPPEQGGVARALARVTAESTEPERWRRDKH
jgi:hypothetical protein